MRGHILAALLMGAALLLPGAELGAQAGAPLRFCAPIGNLPMSDSDPPAGVEVEIARRIAAHLGRPALLHWVEPGEMPEQALADGHCDAALGAVRPDAMARERVAPGLALTDPYYAAGYAVIRRAEAPPVRRLSDLAGTRIAVEVESIPIYTLKQRGHQVYALDDYHAVLRAVRDGRAAYGYLWAPLAAWQLRGRGDVVLEERFEPEDRWSFALAVRDHDQGTLAALNAAVQDLVADGEARRIFAEHGIPYLAPEASPSTRPSR